MGQFFGVYRQEGRELEEPAGVAAWDLFVWYDSCQVWFSRPGNRGSSFLPEALGGLVGGDFAVADVHDAVGVFGDVRLVGDEDDGVAFGLQLIE